MDISPGRSRLTAIAAATAVAAAVVTPIAVAARGAEPSTAAPTTTVPHFASGAAASTAAVGLIRPYIESQFDIDVGDVACSEPDSGDEGAEFVCYGLKPDELVIALRATVAAEKVITLDLITNQLPPPAPESTIPG